MKKWKIAPKDLKECVTRSEWLRVPQKQATRRPQRLGLHSEQGAEVFMWKRFFERYEGLNIKLKKNCKKNLH